MDQPSTAVSRPPGPAAGLREAGKAERLRRLKEATRRLLLTRGYDAATTREISQLAGVSIGTLFVYARDKRDLLYLVVNDELDPVARFAHDNVPESGTALDRLGALLRPWYAYFADNLAIGRCAFREITYYQHHPEDVGEQAVRLRTRMQAQEAHLCEILRDARSRGELVFAESPVLVGSMLYDIYQAEIRAWVFGPAPCVDEGMARLRAKFALLLDRMAAAPG
ncbi:TetR/AcrR family transcriptional regulator [Roseomonas sp. BN140053]|uniref:TetR/AcrR family transcriptional regulator n=1 Tax=Roseomonas sp. BN140053 TaxID=3391898 RepID=UPI0039EC2EEC